MVEGSADPRDRHAQLRRLADLWKSKLDWDFEVGDDEFRDPDGRHGFVFGVAPV